MIEKAILATSGIAVTWTAMSYGFDVYHNAQFAYGLELQDTTLLQKVYQARVGQLGHIKELWQTFGDWKIDHAPRPRRQRK